MKITLNHYRKERKKYLFGNKHLVKSMKIFNEIKNIPGNYQKEHQYKIPIFKLW